MSFNETLIDIDNVYLLFQMLPLTHCFSFIFLLYLFLIVFNSFGRLLNCVIALI